MEPRNCKLTTLYEIATTLVYKTILIYISDYIINTVLWKLNEIQFGPQ